LGECWFIPRWSGKLQVTECTFQTGYQGLAKLAHNSGQIRSLYAYAVYEGDEFDYGLGDTPYVHHKPDPDRVSESDDAIRFFYAVENLTNGGREIEVWSKAHMDDHRDQYVKKDKYGKFPATWVKSYAAMGRKTLVAVVARRGPKSVEMAAALSADGNVRTSLTRDMVFVPEDTAGAFDAQAAEVVDPVSGEIIDAEATEDPGSMGTAEMPESAENGPEDASTALFATSDASRPATSTDKRDLAIALKAVPELKWKEELVQKYGVESRAKLTHVQAVEFMAWAEGQA
jgi:recombination protein RecT